ncbi:MAG: elongation factor G [Alkalispirochaetaceae bacterium]
MGITTDMIRNVAVAGHGGTGKTSLVENMLFYGGAIAKPETTDTGRTVSDYTEEEISQKMSIHTTLSHISWGDTKINILDTPGLADFVGEVVASFRAAESAIIVVGAKAGVEIETIKLWRRLDGRNMPRIVFINKMDVDRADYQKTLDDLREKFDATFVPVTVPIGSGTDYRGVVNLIDMKAYLSPGAGGKERASQIPEEITAMVEEFHATLVESAAEGDDELTMKYLEEENLSLEEVKRGIMEGLRENKVVPVVCGSTAESSGISELLDLIAWAAPSPAGIQEKVLNDAGEIEPVDITVDAPFSGFAFKTSIDQFSGKLSFVKVVTGTLNSSTDLFNAREGKKDKISKIYTMLGKKLEEVSEVVAGDIAVLSKLSLAHTNDSFCTSDRTIHFKPLALPMPVHTVAIEAGAKKDEDKLSDALAKVTEEDKTLIVRFNPETKETVLSGMGELHINNVLNRIMESQKIEVHTRSPKVAYRETINANAESTYRHKKQSGGHGQFGEVSIRIRPLQRGEQYDFANEIKGGSVSKGYIPGIEKGFHEAMNEGVVAGYPVVDVGIALFDGKEHPVDSSEMAFKMAARGALKDAMKKAKPTLLEPIMMLKVFVEEQYLGDVLSDLSSRRGRVQGQSQLGGGIVEIDALVPQAELLKYSIDLRSITSGTGGFEMEFHHYDPISGKIAEDVIKEAEAQTAAVE